MILVTGGAGFIGSNLVASLLAADMGPVIVSDWLGNDGRWRNLANHLINDIIAPEALDAWLAGEGQALKGVLHMGAISSTTVSDGDAVLRQNFQATKQLWQFCTERSLPLVYASSAATYGDGQAGFDDDDSAEALAKLKPLNLYGWSKHWFDRWARDQADRGQPTPPFWAGLKFFNVYGPNEYHKDDMQSVVAKNHASVAAGETVKLFQSHHPDYEHGGQLRDFVYVQDCVDVALWLLRQQPTSGLYNIGTGEARSYRALVEALATANNQPARIDYIPMPEVLRPRYQYFTEARMTKLRQAGYNQPLSSIEDGVQDYVTTYLSQPSPYR
jgi:ADP-L-glycero-D-manno-heptose 6-epimerase